MSCHPIKQDFSGVGKVDARLTGGIRGYLPINRSLIPSFQPGHSCVKVPVYLAAGTAAQQLDATFSTSSSLEIYSLNLAESGQDLPCVAR